MQTGAGRFFDPATGGPAQLQLEQVPGGFRVLRRIAYDDPHHDEPFVVPADPEGFVTDLASVPWAFAWLVPRHGAHLPAAVLHDGLVFTEAEGRTYVGPDIDRAEADRILRDAMGVLGTPRIRRWIMWAGVLLATAFVTLRPRVRWVATVLATVLPVVVLGVLATADLLDVWDVLPWMGERAWWAELALGGLFALLIPSCLALLWGRHRAAGAIVGVLLAFLLHVTTVIAVLYGLYWVLERVVSSPEGTGPAGSAAASRRD